MGSRQAEQLSLCSQQLIVATIEESVLRTEMTDLESQEEDDPKSILFFKPMSWLGQIRRTLLWGPVKLVQGKLVTGCFSNKRKTTCEVITTHPFSSHFRCSCSKFEG